MMDRETAAQRHTHIRTLNFFKAVFVHVTFEVEFLQLK